MCLMLFRKKPYFWLKNGLGRQWAWDLETRPKSWLNGCTFRVNRYLENMFSKFSGLNPGLTRFLSKFPSIRRFNLIKTRNLIFFLNFQITFFVKCLKAYIQILCSFEVKDYRLRTYYLF